MASHHPKKRKHSDYPKSSAASNAIKTHKKPKKKPPQVVIYAHSIGRETRSFDVDKSNLLQSPFFKAAFEGVEKMGGSGEQCIDIDDVDPELIQLLANFVNIRHVAMPGEPKPEYQKLVELWIKAEEWSFRHLQNGAVVGLEYVRASSSEKIFPRKIVRRIYHVTPPESPLRRYVADCYVRFHTDKLKDIDKYPADFITDIIDNERRVYQNPSSFSHKEMTRYFVKAK